MFNKDMPNMMILLVLDNKLVPDNNSLKNYIFCSTSSQSIPSPMDNFGHWLLSFELDIQ
jgi:hypothetical protein